MCGQNVEFVNVKSRGKLISQWILTVIFASLHCMGALSCDTFLGHLALEFQFLFPMCDSPFVEFVNIKM